MNLFAFSNFEANFLLFATMAVSTSLWLVALSKTFLMKITMVAELVGFCNFLFLTLYFCVQLSVAHFLLSRAGALV